MNLIRDVLDNQIVDRSGRRLGKVDGIVIELRESGPPVLRYIESGWAVKASRVHPRLVRWFRRWLSPPYRIPWTRVRDVGVDLQVALDDGETPLLRTEVRLRRILTKIPGA
jgi:sporulation protein YlmC with PRC-barrel domain